MITRQLLQRLVLSGTVLFWFGCGDDDSSEDLSEDNDMESAESPFFILRAKAQPMPPECTVSANDPEISKGLLDLSLGNRYSQFFQVRNALESTDTSSLRASTNGIFIDRSEVSLSSKEEGSLGTHTRSHDTYLDPDSVNINFSELISPEQGEALAILYDCLPLSRDNYSLEAIAGNEDNPAGGDIFTVQARVTFHGHTNGDVIVATPPFDFEIELCCGCLVNWANCASYCDAYCVEPSMSTGTCGDGIKTDVASVDCRRFYYNSSATWDSAGDCRDDEGNLRPCTCDDCTT